MSYISYPMRETVRGVYTVHPPIPRPLLYSLITAFIIFADLLNSYNRQRLLRSLAKGSGENKLEKKTQTPPECN